MYNSSEYVGIHCVCTIHDFGEVCHRPQLNLSLSLHLSTDAEKSWQIHLHLSDPTACDLLLCVLCHRQILIGFYRGLIVLWNVAHGDVQHAYISLQVVYRMYFHSIVIFCLLFSF